METTYAALTKNNYVLKNVRLETAFMADEDGVFGTRTELFCIEINDGKITKILPNNTQLAGAVDAKGLLMLPAFKDMHVHIDKTLYGLPWQALSPKRKTVQDMIAYEQEIIPRLLETSTHRAELLINLLQNYGTTFARTHFNVDTTGGLDPFSIDKNIEKAIDFTVRLAIDNNKGIDIHLHDAGKEGIRTIGYLAEQALFNPQLQGRTFVSHAFALAYLPPKEVEEMAEKLAAARVGIVSAIPFRNRTMPIPTLVQRGVEVLVGNDNVQDYWSTFGSGNMLQKAHLMAELYGWTTEFELSRTLRFATHNVLPLDDKGNKQWPKTGDTAEFVLIDAGCSAEAVARMSGTAALAHGGNLYWKS